MEKITSSTSQSKSLDQDFSVVTYTILDENSKGFMHWSEGLYMIITKDGVTIKLQEEEIEKLVKSLPRTFGGIY